MTQIVQQPYNLFAQQKMAGYPSYQDTQKRVPGQVQGETPEQFAAGKQAANSQSGAVSQPVVEQTPAPVVQNTKSQPSGNTKVVTAPMDANSPTAGMDYLNSLYTSPQEEERLRKASVMNQRILAIGDALRHIGNIANTVNYAPSQQFNNPALEAEARYEKGKALRDRANQQYYTYQQAKAAQDAKARQWEADYNLKMADAARKAGYTEAQIKNMQDRLKQQGEHNKVLEGIQQGRLDETIRSNKARQESTDRHNRRMEGIAGMNAKTNRDRATAYINKLKGGSSASGTPLVTPNGSIYAPGKSIPQAQMNQLYKKGIDSGWIKQSEFQTKMREAGFGKADPDYVRNQMVVEAMMEHGDFADFARDNYGWQYGSNGSGGNNLSIGWDDDEDKEEDNGLSIGW